ncbi:MAG: 2OG-Fe(II) oxygenase [Flavobacteriales bacterium]|nr:2OG-Fe(II) oxygenase [Flavobacteriales bacterium]
MSVVRVYKNFFSKELIEELDNYIINLFRVPNNNFFVTMPLRERADRKSAWYMQPQLNHYIEGDFYDRIRDHVNVRTAHTEMEFADMFLTFMDTHQSLAWHRDNTSGRKDVVSESFRIPEKRNGSITVHLSKNWTKEDGGLFKYGHKNHPDIMVPEHNVAIQFDTSIYHCVTEVTKPWEEMSIDHLRKTLQIWMKKRV